MSTNSSHPHHRPLVMSLVGLMLFLTLPWLAAQEASAPITGKTGQAARLATDPSNEVASASPGGYEPKEAGGESDSIVQVANLVYAGSKSSKCFSNHFLAQAEKDSAISTSGKFHTVRLDSDELFDFPLIIMTGEGTFSLPDKERQNLRRFIERGGFLLASAGCSSADWDRSFRAEMAQVFPEYALSPIGLEHAIFHTVYEIKSLEAKHGTPRPLEGITLGGRLGVLYSQDGLNDTSHAQGCCCCGGNEITNCIQVNVNILAYALVY
jgi:hypothetical protein